MRANQKLTIVRRPQFYTAFRDMSTAEREKQNAARASIAFIRDGMRVGLGTGSTVKYLLDELGQLCRQGLAIECVATSRETEHRARRLGISVKDLRDLPVLDLTIDGTDQFDGNKNLIKGGHGAMLREKVVAASAARFLVIADSTKQAEGLNMAVPVEFVPFAMPLVQSWLGKLNSVPELRMSAGQPFVTEHGNHIFEASFGVITDPEELADRIARIPGVAAHGLFLGMADHIIVGREHGAEIIR